MKKLGEKKSNYPFNLNFLLLWVGGDTAIEDIIWLF